MDQQNDGFDDSAAHEGESLVQPLPQDNATPFSPPVNANDPSVDDPQDQAGAFTTDTISLDDTHQATDNATNIDSQQLYDEGLAGAAEASEPNAGNTVTGYDPDTDQRRQQN